MPTIRPLQRLSVVFVTLAIIQTVSAGDAFGQKNELPKSAKPWPQLSREGVSAYVSGNTLWLQLDKNALKSKKAVIPRLCAPIRSIHWKGHSDAELRFRPEPQEWTFFWKADPTGASLIEVVFDATPVLPPDCPSATPAGDSSVMLHAYQASTFGEKLRFEPQWYKNTVGYWVLGTDYATWDLTIDQPGGYSIAVLQGCGKGQGGSDAVVSLRQGDQVKAELPFQTIDTGHFQNFRWHDLGTIKLAAAGKYKLRIDAKRIAKVALFDVRTIHLVRQAQSPK